MPNDLGQWLFDSSVLTPHGFCLLWQPGLIWTYALSDVGIGLAYFSIPLALAVFVRRRNDLVFRPVFLLFAAFILLCGTSHWFDVLTLWVPAYGAEAIIKALTAIVSIITAVMLWRLLPQALALPSAAQLKEANEALRVSEARLHQAQKMEAVGQLTGGIAHDFNNMLQGIAGGMDLMERRIAQGRAEEVPVYAAAVRQALDRASSLTHRLMAFSRQQALQPRPVEPDALVRGMEELMQRTVGPGIRLDLRLRDGIWSALCDPNQLESALLNLAINARDAMPDGGVITIITTDRPITSADLPANDEAKPGDYVEIAVTDTGTGMSADVLARAFEPFFTTKLPGQGTGLGLSQIYGFARQSGGFVTISSELGRGTSVRLLLPRHEASADTATPTEAPPSPEPDPPPISGGVVLVVDDEAAIRAQIAETLREMNWTVLEAADGQTGLAIVQATPRIDLLITDVGLPELNGRLLAEQARSIVPGLPVILITGYAGAAIDDMRFAPDMELLRKPFTLDGLAAQVNAMMKRAGPR